MKSSRRALLAILCLCSSVAVAADDVDRALSSIHPEAIRAHMTFLADDLLEGRDTGSIGYDIAARYVASQLMAVGADPRGADGSWFQPIPFRKAVPVANEVVMSSKGFTHRLEW